MRVAEGKPLKLSLNLRKDEQMGDGKVQRGNEDNGVGGGGERFG